MEIAIRIADNPSPIMPRGDFIKSSMRLAPSASDVSLPQIGGMTSILCLKRDTAPMMSRTKSLIKISRKSQSGSLPSMTRVRASPFRMSLSESGSSILPRLDDVPVFRAIYPSRLSVAIIKQPTTTGGAQPRESDLTRR